MNFCTVMMTENNIHGRTILETLRARNVNVDAIIIEHGSDLAERAKSYLENDWFVPVKVEEFVRDERIPVWFVSNFNNDTTKALLRSTSAELVVLGGARILQREVIEIPEVGILNAHPGLLPEYRGRDVVAWAIANDDAVGATCHFIDEGVDSGPILLRESIEKLGRNLLETRVMTMKLCAKLMAEAVLRLPELEPIEQEAGEGRRYGSFPEERLEEVEEKLKKG